MKREAGGFAPGAPTGVAAGVCPQRAQGWCGGCARRVGVAAARKTKACHPGPRQNEARRLRNAAQQGHGDSNQGWVKNANEEQAVLRG